jgi:hypothetical protein
MLNAGEKPAEKKEFIMAELPHPWGAYRRLQSQLDASTKIDERNWGLESGLNEVLEGARTATFPPDEDIARAISSEARRERHRAHLRRKHLAQSDELPDPRSLIEARSDLSVIRSLVSAADWDLLIALGKGREYQELGVPGRLRVRVLRLRRDLLRGLSAAA